ncbi:MAG: hypothetical protein KDH09_01850 [Chrysiogenetes bacterium]|nr:hypothetical protein [Chrysiogenetes bacterium]
MSVISTVNLLQRARESGRPLVLAHRGGRHLYPENTLEAFSRCFSDGAEGVELDVRCTRDGKVVVFHDAELETLTDGQGRASHKSWEEIRTIRVRNHQGDLTDQTIPRFEEVLEALPVDGFLNVEIKFERGSYPGNSSLPLVRRTLEVLRGESAFGERPVIISSFSMQVNLQLRALARDFARGYLFEQRWGVPRYRRIGDRLLAAHALHPAKELVSDELMAAARRAGREVAVWTVNEPDDMRRLARMGVGALITDRPDIGREVVDSLGQGGGRA